MKTATKIIHIAAFSACFAVYAAGSGGVLSGVRRAMQTFSAVQVPAADVSFNDAAGV